MPQSSLSPPRHDERDRPDEATLAALTCPVDRARAVGLVARTKGTLSAPLAAVRRAALVEALGTGEWTVTKLAATLSLTISRICQILKTVTAARIEAEDGEVA